MMGYYDGMMGAGWGVFGVITWIAILIDLVLLGVLLWKQILKK